MAEPTLTDPATAPAVFTGPKKAPPAPAPAPAPAASPNPTLTPDPDRPALLALGLELKFLVPFLRAAHPDPTPTDPRPAPQTPHADDPPRLLAQATDLVCGALSAAGQRAIAAADIAAGGGQESDFWAGHWVVKRSNSAEAGPGAPAAYVHAPLEISSPRMPALEGRTREVIANVVRALEGCCRLVVNYTCEMHVHVGHADGASPSLATLQNLAALSWLCEPALRLLKDPASPNFKHVFTWSSPLRERSRLAGVADGHGTCGGAAAARNSFALQAVFAARTTVELGKLMSGEEKQYRRLGFNFSSFGLEDERAGRSPRSVEVRFFEDYRGLEEILGWVEVCVAMGTLAVEERRGRFWRAVAELSVGDGGGSARERMERLLGMLGVEEGVVGLFGKRVEEIHKEVKGKA